MIDLEKIEHDLISEIKLKPLEAKLFLLVTLEGKKTSAETISERLKISKEEVINISKELVKLGGFIELSDTEFQAMHPRFTAVNMYRRMCERQGIDFKRNNIVDNIGVNLEKHYDNCV
jgi:DNA-binding Lrp family transcriptional regulator